MEGIIIQFWEGVGKFIEFSGLIILFIIGLGSTYFLMALPGLILYKLVLIFSKKIKNENKNILINTGLLAFVVTPSPRIAHVSLYPAFWNIFDSDMDKWTLGIIPILVFWGIAAATMFWRRSRKSKAGLS